MKKNLLLLLSFLVADFTDAATVAWSAFDNTGIINSGLASSAAALPTGNWVQIGYFDSTLGANQTAINAAITSDSQTVSGTATLAAAFHTFGSLQINTGSQSGNGAGGFSASSSLSLTSNPSFASQQIYLWALNATNNTSLATAYSSVTQQAIAYIPLSITTPDAATQAWQFPASDTAGNVAIELKSLTTSGTKILDGSFITGANNTSLNSAGFPTLNNALQLATVASAPEPDRSVLCGFALIGLILRRRRK